MRRMSENKNASRQTLIDIWIRLGQYQLITITPSIFICVQKNKVNDNNKTFVMICIRSLNLPISTPLIITDETIIFNRLFYPLFDDEARRTNR